MEYLFDRLCLGSTRSRGESATFGGSGGIEASVTRELERITSQRQYFEGFEYRRDTSDRENVLGFGISRGIGEVLNAPSARTLALEIRRAILANEPRLLRPTVSVKGSDKGGRAFMLMIRGFLKIDEQMIDYKRHFSTLGVS